MTEYEKVRIESNKGRSIAYEDTSFTSGESPRTLDINNDLGRNAKDGYIINDGSGSLLISISDNGTDYGSQHTIKKNEELILEKEDIDSVKLTHSGTNTAYRTLFI